MSTTFNMSDAARHFGISRSAAFCELPSWPHMRVNGETTFSADDFAAIQKMKNADPDAQPERLQFIEQKLAAVRAPDSV